MNMIAICGQCLENMKSKGPLTTNPQTGERSITFYCTSCKNETRVIIHPKQPLHER